MGHSELFSAFLISALALALLPPLLGKIGIPGLVSFLIAGILIGPSGLNWVRSLPAAQTLSELGLVFLLFALGLELSLSQIRKLLGPLLSYGAGQAALVGGLGFILFLWAFDLSWKQSLIFSALLALSSTAIVLRLLSQKRESETPHGRISILILLFQDLWALPLMFLIPWLAESSQPQSSFWRPVALPVVFVLLSLWVGKKILPFLMGAVSKTGIREVFFFFVIALTLGMGWLAEQMGLSMALGAFLAGLLISESPYNKQALAELSPLRDVFLGFFFVSVGMLLDLSFAQQHFLQLLWLVPLLFGIKVLGTYWVIRALRNTHGIALGVALILAQVGEFSFLLAATAKQYELIGETEFQYFLSLAVLSLLFSPLVVGWGLRTTGHSSWSKLALILRRQTPQPKQDPVVNIELERRCFVIGLGHAGLSTLKRLQELGIPCTGIDFNMQNVERASKLSLDALFGDATRKDFLEEAGVANSFLVIVTVSGKHLVQELVDVLHHLRRVPQILVRTHFVQDLEGLQHLSPQDIIVSEQTTTDAIVEKALSRYQIVEL